MLATECTIACAEYYYLDVIRTEHSKFCGCGPTADHVLSTHVPCRAPKAQRLFIVWDMKKNDGITQPAYSNCTVALL